MLLQCTSKLQISKISKTISLARCRSNISKPSLWPAVDRTFWKISLWQAVDQTFQQHCLTKPTSPKTISLACCRSNILSSIASPSQTCPTCTQTRFSINTAGRLVGETSSLAGLTAASFHTKTELQESKEQHMWIPEQTNRAWLTNGALRSRMHTLGWKLTITFLTQGITTPVDCTRQLYHKVSAQFTKITSPNHGSTTDAAMQAKLS